GSGSDHFTGSFLSALGLSQVSYTPFGNSCGMTPDEFPVSEVFPGGSIAGNDCWDVLSTDVSSLVMFDALEAPVRRTFFPCIDLMGSGLLSAKPDDPLEVHLAADGRPCSCGDSTNAEEVGRLMDVKQASLLATDPPYLVD